MNGDGLVLQKIPGKFNEGAYGTVFFLEDGKVIKVYKKHREGDESHSRATFCSETGAYELAYSSENLRSLVPEYFGPAEVAQILSADGKDITNQYYPDLNFMMEFIPGQFRKIGVIGGEEVERIIALFAAAGIHYLKDASAVVGKHGVEKLVDFGVEEIELWAKD